MERFENKLCPVCRARFNGSAEVVVCPVCGTPHHKVCYMINNRCAYEDRHSTGYVWNGHLPDEPAPETEPEKTEEINYNENTASGDITLLLNQIMSENPDSADGQNGNDTFTNAFKRIFPNFQSREIGEDGVSFHELIAYTGSSAWHYGKAFSLFRGGMDGKKHFVSFNLFSGLFAPSFQFYRKMDLFGVIILALMLLPSLLIRFTTDGAGIGAVNINTFPIVMLNIINTVIVILLCLFGDYIYYRHVVRQIKKVRKSYSGDTLSDEYFSILCEKGTPSFMRAILGCLAVVFAEVCVMVL